MTDMFYSFEKATNFNVLPFIEDMQSFLRYDYPSLQKYFTGDITEVGQETFKKLFDLRKTCNQILVLMDLNKHKLATSEFVDLFELIDNYDTTIDSILKLPKWVRANLNNFSWDNTVVITRPLRRGESLDSVAFNFFQDIDSWAQLAKENNLLETDYSVEGGKKIDFKDQENTFNTFLTSIVDIIDGTSIYGKDLDKRISFNQDEEDLEVLTPEESIEQAVDILANLRKNDNPDSPTSGLQASIVIGSNRNTLNFPIIDRQMSETFQTDDSLVNFSLKSVKVDEDKLLVEFQVQSRDSEVYSKTVFF